MKEFKHQHDAEMDSAAYGAKVQKYRAVSTRVADMGLDRTGNKPTETPTPCSVSTSVGVFCSWSMCLQAHYTELEYSSRGGRTEWVGRRNRKRYYPHMTVWW
jgi:hypothetical protein